MSQYTDYLLVRGAKIHSHSVVKHPKLELQDIYSNEIISIKEIVVFSISPDPNVYEVFVDEKKERRDRKTIIEKRYRVFEGEMPAAQYTQKPDSIHTKVKVWVENEVDEMLNDTNDFIHFIRVYQVEGDPNNNSPLIQWWDNEAGEAEKNILTAAEELGMEIELVWESNA